MCVNSGTLVLTPAYTGRKECSGTFPYQFSSGKEGLKKCITTQCRKWSSLSSWADYKNTDAMVYSHIVSLINLVLHSANGRCDHNGLLVEIDGKKVKTQTFTTPSRLYFQSITSIYTSSSDYLLGMT